MATPWPPSLRGNKLQDGQGVVVKIRYNPKLKSFSRQLRNNSTLSEALLWNQLKARKIKGYQFMRQKPIDEYIVDFYCSKLKLVIEIDGESHSEKADADLKRQKRLEATGLSVLRFFDRDVKKNIEGVVSVIGKWIEDNSLKGEYPPPTPFIKGE
ncbi:MAG: endonuclease domain-containing protein [Deltaproteobacteria bacterium]|nr:endonuclease domain-containing protein [Deltaproteobacteria bacterium]